MGRAFGFLGTIIVMAVGMYIYSIQLKDTSAPGNATTPTGTANIVGVKNDLISIANAERGYFATEQKYVLSMSWFRDTTSRSRGSGLLILTTLRPHPRFSRDRYAGHCRCTRSALDRRKHAGSVVELNVRSAGVPSPIAPAGGGRYLDPAYASLVALQNLSGRMI